MPRCFPLPRRRVCAVIAANVHASARLSLRCARKPCWLFTLLHCACSSGACCHWARAGRRWVGGRSQATASSGRPTRSTKPRWRSSLPRPAASRRAGLRRAASLSASAAASSPAAPRSSAPAAPPRSRCPPCRVARCAFLRAVLDGLASASEHCATLLQEGTAAAGYPDSTRRLCAVARAQFVAAVRAVCEAQLGGWHASQRTV